MSNKPNDILWGPVQAEALPWGTLYYRHGVSAGAPQDSPPPTTVRVPPEPPVAAVREGAGNCEPVPFDKFLAELEKLGNEPFPEHGKCYTNDAGGFIEFALAPHSRLAAHRRCDVVFFVDEDGNIVGGQVPKKLPSEPAQYGKATPATPELVEGRIQDIVNGLEILGGIHFPNANAFDNQEDFAAGCQEARREVADCIRRHFSDLAPSLSAQVLEDARLCASALHGGCDAVGHTVVMPDSTLDAARRILAQAAPKGE